MATLAALAPGASVDVIQFALSAEDSHEPATFQFPVVTLLLKLSVALDVWKTSKNELAHVPARIPKVAERVRFVPIAV